MIIYATQFNKSDGEITAKSVDSNFGTIQQVIDALGDSYGRKTKRTVYYDGVVFSDYPFLLEDVEK